jgi:hypothetical protein
MSRKFLEDHLKLWKDLGIPAPENELQSIDAWLHHLCQHGEEETKKAMRKRMILLLQAANDLHARGPEAEDAAGIFERRPRKEYTEPVEPVTQSRTSIVWKKLKSIVGLQK